MSKKYKSLTLCEKKKVLEAVDAGGKKKDIAEKFAIPQLTLSTILKQREKVLAAPPSGSRKRDIHGEFPELEECLVQWLTQCRQRNVPISGPMVMEKAKAFAASLKIVGFNASRGWLDKFKNRKGLAFHKVCGESAAVDNGVCGTWKEALSARIKDFEPHNIFNADETGLFFKCLPSHTLAFKNEKCHGGKSSKERVTILLAANMDGTEKLKPVMIGKSAKPRCFKGVKSFPMHYKANTKAWMTSLFFKEWLLQLNREMAAQNRKILLFVDNCTAHNDIPSLDHIKVKFFPPNTTSKLQPLDQGIICNFKVLYRTQVVQKLIANLDAGEDSEKISILDAMQMADKAWRNVAPSTIANYFRTSGFVKADRHMPLNDPYLLAPDPTLLWEKISDTTEEPLSFNEFVHFDDDISTMGSLSDKEILQNVTSEVTEDNEEEEEASENQEVQDRPSNCDAQLAMTIVRRYLQQNADLDERGFSLLHGVESLIEQQLVKNVRFKSQIRNSIYICLILLVFISPSLSIQNHERKRFRRPISSFTKAQPSENNIPALTDLEASSTANRFKLYRRTSKPFYKSKTTESANDLETAASVNRAAFPPRHAAKLDANLTDIEPQESTHKVRLLSRRGPKPRPEAIQDADQETSSSINRNNIQRRISKPSQGNSLVEGEANIDQENLSSTNRLKIRRRISKPENLNSATDEVKQEDQESSLTSRFKIRQKLNGLSGSTSNRKSAEEPKDEDGYKIVCYYTNWSQYRPKIGKYMPEDIEPDLCTHIIFAFGWLKKGRLSSFESNDETKDGKIGLYDRIMNLKKANPKLKILLAIGGWSFGTQKFKDMVATRYTRQTFIYSAVPFLRQRNFDGLDIDWEYPKGSDDKKNLVQILKELREAFEAEAQEVKKPRLLLTAAVPVGPDNIKGGYDVPAVASYLDFINIMAYDFHGKWEREAGHNAPLYSSSTDSEWRKQLSVDNAAAMWARLGAPKNKLIIGMPTYGRSFTLSNPANFKINSPASGGGKAGEYTKESGFLGYYEICEMLKNGASYIWDDEMKVPYAVAGDQWVGFDDERSIRNKMQWLKNNSYGGAMVWTVDMDDFSGTVCGGNVKYPLIGAMREELRGIKRANNAKDVDWSKVANSINLETITKPAPIKINVNEILQQLKPANSKSASIQVAAPKNERPSQILCYTTSWSQKRPGIGKFTPENIDASLCTHVIYAFGALKDNRLTISDDKEDKEDESYAKVTALKEKNPALKILLAIGGWAFGSTPFKELTSNVFRMNQFVYEAIEFLREYKFDGLDVDWEYPRGSDDKTAYVNLLKELRTAFEGEAKTSGQPRLMLTAAVPASFEAIAAGYDVPEISKYLDFINVMTYDFHGQWERQVGHNSPLHPLESATSYQKKLTVDYSAKEWIKQGAPKEKLMIGMPTYGRSFTLVDSTKFDIGAPASGGGTPGQYTGEAGFMSYYEICEFLRVENTTLVWDNEQQVPFAYRGDQWVGFDDERSLKTKMAWLKEEGFGGIMVWSIDMDDFRGTCGSGKYPLMQAMKQELDGYSVKLEYDGPYESSSLNTLYTTKDPTTVSCEEEDGHISYHPDKADCTMYYMCEGERKHHMPCPSNLVFNPKENVCDWPENVEGCMHHTQAPPTSRRR